MEDKFLTEKDLKDISLGYNWDPEMGLERFIEMNPKLAKDQASEMFDLIEGRYIEAKFS